MKIIETALLADMFRGGYEFLAVNKEYVDSLNVFPVPDGDTGTNMSLTMSSAVKELDSLDAGCDKADVLKSVARGTLRGARGNSGVILSQIMKGLATGLEDEAQITTKAFARALLSAREMAYNAVTKPKEGTVLTVIRYMAENAPSIANKNSDFVTFFDLLIKKGEEILQKTPEMLPVLKKAGVVDAGGRGLLCVFNGFYRVVAGLEIESVPEEVVPPTPAAMSVGVFGTDEHDYNNIKYAYCTEYFVINLKRHCTEEDVNKLRDSLMSIGDCVIVIGDISLIKVHVHTNQPNRALAFALKLGELDKVKIENMLQQSRAIQAERERTKKPIALLSICSGQGLAKIFTDFGVDCVIEGGQTMNPSVEDILNAVESINSDNIIILPNNKNIIMAAERVSELTKKNIFIVPTVEVAQGVQAVLKFDEESSPEDNCKKMQRALRTLKCAELTHAVRNTEMDGLQLSEGDIIGLHNGKIVCKSDSVKEALLEIVDNLADEDTECITLYYGEDVSEEDAQICVAALQEKYGECDVVCYNGGQPHYYYLLSVE